MPVVVAKANSHSLCKFLDVMDDSFMITFQKSVVRKEIVEASRTLFNRGNGGTKKAVVQFEFVKFASEDLILGAIELIETFDVTKVSITMPEWSVAEFGSLFAYCVRARVGGLQLILRDRWNRVFIENLPNMSLKSLAISCIISDHDMQDLWDNLCVTLKTLVISDSRISGDFLITKKHDVLNGVSILNVPNEWTTFAPLMLSYCKSLISVNIQYKGLTSFVTLDKNTTQAILTHPSVVYVNVEGVSFGSQLGIEKAVKNKNRVHYRAMMAFLSKCIDRVGVRCIARRLFRDADMLIWSYLV